MSSSVTDSTSNGCGKLQLQRSIMRRVAIWFGMVAMISSLLRVLRTSSQLTLNLHPAGDVLSAMMHMQATTGAALEKYNEKMNSTTTLKAATTSSFLFNETTTRGSLSSGAPDINTSKTLATRPQSDEESWRTSQKPTSNTSSNNASAFFFTIDNSISHLNYSIFYNIYIPESRQQKGIDNALRIVREQLRQVGESFVVRDALKRNQKVTLYYNTIGKTDAITQDFMDYHCTEKNDIVCIHMQHYESGNYEQVTLTKLHEYCQANPLHNHKVTYLHTKGSFHDDHRQDYWRRSMTGAATGEACITKRQPAPATEDHSSSGNFTISTNSTFNNASDEATSRCNVCGLMFHPVWTNFFPGNVSFNDIIDITFFFFSRLAPRN